MAQVCGGSNFDFLAQRKHDAALSILSHVADIWAAHRETTLSPDSVIAILLRIFISSRFGARDESRSLESWLSLVGNAREEAGFLIPAPSEPTIEAVLTELHAELSFAAEQWSLGDPEQPPTVHALNAVEHVLFTHRLTHRPAASKLPKSLRNADLPLDQSTRNA